MMVTGESIYAGCQNRRTMTAGFKSGMTLSCPFVDVDQPEKWCTACLVAKIKSLQQELRAVSERAFAAANTNY